MAYLPEELQLATVNCFGDLQLDELDEAWVNEVNFSEFSCETECPTTIFAEDLMDSVLKVLEIIKKWLERPDQLTDESVNTSAEEELVIWKIFMDNDIEVKTILALIFLLCSRGVKSSASLADKLLGLNASKLYFNLLQIQGSNAYSIYNPELVKVAVSSLKIPKERPQSKKRIQASVYRNEVASQRKRVHRENSDFAEADEPMENDQSPENDNFETVLDDRETQKLLSCFAEFLVDFVNFISSFPLRKDPEVVDHVVTKLLDFTAFETRYTDFNYDADVNELFKAKKRFGLEYSLTALAYKTLLTLCLPLHGKEENNYLLILKSLSQNILCIKARSQSNQTIPHKFLVIKDNAISFVCYNLIKFPEYSVACSRVLIQQLCMRVSDKSDFRTKIARAILSILKEFPVQEYASMIKWFELLVNQPKVPDRVMGLEIMSYLVLEPERTAVDLPDELSSYITYVPIVNAIIERCHDKAATVRSKAMNVLANNLQKILFIFNETNMNRSKGTDCESEVSSNLSSSLDVDSDLEVEKPEQHAQILVPAEPIEQLDKIGTLLCNRAKDLKVHVRKASLQGLENLICLNKKYLSDENLELFRDAALDPNITVKKAIISSISAVLQKYKHSPKVQSCWLQCILPLILDPEKSVQSKCMEVMEMQFLNNINGSDSERSCAWGLLNNIACGEHYSQQRLLSKAFTLWKVEGKLKTNLRTILEREVGSENNSAAWLMLSFLTMNIEVKNTSFIINYWEECCKLPHDNPSVKQMVLQVISNTCKHLNQENLRAIQEKLEHDIMRFECPVELIGVSIEALFKLYDVQSSRQDNYHRIISNFASEVMKSSETFLSSLVLEQLSSVELHSENLICQHLFTLGDLALLCPSVIPEKVYLIIQSMIASSNIEDDRSSNHSGHNAHSSVRAFHERGFPPKIQAVAFVTLGKLCLQNEDLAKKCIPALARELINSKHYVIRNNIVIVLTDLCIRYTSAVDLYIPSISACLKDNNSLVRHQALTLLSRLLQEDYIKSKDSLMYRMLSMIIDDDKKIRNLAEYCFGHMMVKRNPAIFHQHFIECVYFFNAHPDSKTNLTNFDQDVKLFALKGDRLRNKRMAIYKFMLKNSSAQKRFGISLKVCLEVLGSVADNVLPLDTDGEAVLKDCLRVLSSEEIKLPSLHGASGDDAEETDAVEAIAVKAAQRVSLVQVVIPIVISLKKLLFELKSPLFNELMVFLREICKDYKNELKDMFATDKVLGHEIEFDIRRYEQEVEKMKKNEENKGQSKTVTTTKDQDALLISVSKAKRISNRLTGNSLVEDLDLNGSITGISSSAPIMSNISASPELQPHVHVERLSPEVCNQYANSGASPMLPSRPKSRRENDPASQEPVVASTSNAPGQSALENMNPVVVIKHMSKKAIQRYSNIVSSTPFDETVVSRVIPKETNISNIRISDTTSQEQNSSVRTRREKSKRKGRKN